MAIARCDRAIPSARSGRRPGASPLPILGSCSGRRAGCVQLPRRRADPVPSCGARWAARSDRHPFSPPSGDGSWLGRVLSFPHDPMGRSASVSSSHLQSTSRRFSRHPASAHLDRPDGGRRTVRPATWRELDLRAGGGSIGAVPDRRGHPCPRQPRSGATRIAGTGGAPGPEGHCLPALREHGRPRLLRPPGP